MNDISNKKILLISLAWLIFNLLIGAFQPLLGDEAYYWEYARYPALGYFDHPPMLAWLIYPFAHIQAAYLDVRLLAILVSCIAFYLLAKQGGKLFYVLLLASVPLIHGMSALALPDAPLFLFGTLYFIVLQRYLENDHWKNTILLSLIIAAMIYSKYHGILIIIATLIANPSVLKRRSFYIVFYLSTLFLGPHIWWQISHELPSVKYHFSGRFDPSTQSNFIYFIISQVLCFGPLLYLYVKQVKRADFRDTWLRILHLSVFCVFSVFLINALFNWTEAHWTYLATIPMYLTIIHKKESSSSKAINGLFLWLAILIFLRIMVACKLVPNVAQLYKLNERNALDASWAQSIEEVAADRPVVFMNSYPHAALYNYYTKSTAIHWNELNGRESQYGIWLQEKPIATEKVVFIPSYNMNTEKSIDWKGGSIPYIDFDSFQAFKHISFYMEALKEGILSGYIEGPRDIVNIPAKSYLTIIGYTAKGKANYIEKLLPLQDLFSSNHFQVPITIPEDIEFVQLGIRNNYLPASVHSDILPLSALTY